MPVEYAIQVIIGGNDGHPANDRPTSDEQAAATDLAARLSEIVQIPVNTLRARAAAAAYAHGPRARHRRRPGPLCPARPGRSPRIRLAG